MKIKKLAVGNWQLANFGVLSAELRKRVGSLQWAVGKFFSAKCRVKKDS